METRPVSHNLQNIREKYIRALSNATNSTQKAKELAEDLFALDLTVYSKNFSFNSIMYNAFAHSEIDENISMHPEQIEILNQIKNNDALIISAPTSFGKTFCIFEYIAKNYPQNIVLIVPTLALVDEYLKKIIKKYANVFSRYKIHTNINDETQYNFNLHNIFVLTHDRVVQETSYALIERIDLLVIDEVYKLEKDSANDRVLVLNLAYYHLAEKASKYILLAPFIKDIEDRSELAKKPRLYKSNYSPVVNEVIVNEIVRETDRNQECNRILSELGQDDKTLIYFPTVTGIYKYVNEILDNEKDIEINDSNITQFIDWAKDEVHEKWYLIRALEKGYLVHNGQLPIGTRLFQMDLYEKSEEYNKMLCTSTLLEGVNTTAKNIIITKPSRSNPKELLPKPFTAFDFYNLVGRTGRLYKHFLGTAYYLKGANDPVYTKDDAIKSIKFELTDESKDMDIQRGNFERHPDFMKFLKDLNITYDEYMQKIGGRSRFDTVKRIYESYIRIKHELINELNNILNIPKYGRPKLIKLLYTIIEGKENKLEATIINQLLNRQRHKLKTIIDNTMEHTKIKQIDFVITTAIRLKSSYIEHEFYSKCLLIEYFLEKDGVENDLLEVLKKTVISAIEQLYFSASKHKKMLLDLGIYERDIDKVIQIIGDDFDDASELKRRLGVNIFKLSKMSFITKYVVRNLV
ncbi:MAG: hypothetical protein A2Y24_04180 [Clostridiales bacterium GWE2_32_10]|nr:MAG: hypothetical protein A2Y24_04180 [Clostridiales bacterium GWE2_32_10]